MSCSKILSAIKNEHPTLINYNSKLNLPNMRKKNKVIIVLISIAVLMIFSSNYSQIKGENSLIFENIAALNVMNPTEYSGYTDWDYCDIPFFCETKRTVEAPDKCVDKSLLWYHGWALCTYH